MWRSRVKLYSPGVTNDSFYDEKKYRFGVSSK